MKRILLCLVLLLSFPAFPSGDAWWNLIGGFTISGDCNDADIIVYNGASHVCVAVSGDATITNAGVVTIANDSHSHTSTTLPSTIAYTDQAKTISAVWTHTGNTVIQDSAATKYLDLRPQAAPAFPFNYTTPSLFFTAMSYDFMMFTGTYNRWGIKAVGVDNSGGAPTSISYLDFGYGYSDASNPTPSSVFRFYPTYIDMQSHKISNVTTPSASGDAATKGYVDSQISGIPTPNLQSVTDSGSTTTNAITVATINTGFGAAEIPGTYNPNIPPSSPDTLDDEFSDSSFSGWTWQGTTPATIDESTYSGLVLISHTGTTTSYAYKSTSLSGDFTIRVRLLADNVNTAEHGIFVSDASGNGHVIGMRNLTTTVLQARVIYGSLSTWTPSTSYITLYYPYRYVEISRVSGTLYYRFSDDGVVYQTITSTSDSATFTKVGLYVGTIAGNTLGYDWFRRVN